MGPVVWSVSESVSESVVESVVGSIVEESVSVIGPEESVSESVSDPGPAEVSVGAREVDMVAVPTWVVEAVVVSVPASESPPPQPISTSPDKPIN